MRSGGDSLQRLRLRDGDPGEVVADRLMPTAHLVPGLVKIDGYSQLVRLVRDTFDIVPGQLHRVPVRLAPRQPHRGS